MIILSLTKSSKTDTCFKRNINSSLVVSINTTLEDKVINLEVDIKLN